MRVFLLGGGGREHAIARALAASGGRICVLMRNRNPGILRLAEEVEIGPETDIDRVRRFAARTRPELAVVGPEAPLERGVVDMLQDMGVPCASPVRRAALLETSKVFMREVMRSHDIPGSVRCEVVTDIEAAREVIDRFGGSVAVKPDGLTGGKGVKVSGDHLKDREECLGYVREILERRIGGSSRVLIEERLDGEEFSLQALTDGTTLLPTPLVQDHKRLLEGDLGPNTGGMGSYSCEDHLLPFISERDRDEAFDIMRRVVSSLRTEGITYRGILYGQFMLTAEGPRVVEFNARFADPECLNILPIMETPLLDALHAVAEGRLGTLSTRFSRQATVCRYAVPRGYGTPEPRSDVPVYVDEELVRSEGCVLYYAAVDLKGEQTLTTRSRTLAVVGIGDDLDEAEARCTAGMGHVRGDVFSRRDIGTRSLVERRIAHMRSLGR